MKATGIVRRIDELGRIVIPKEIRRTFKIREGTPLEIFCGEKDELIIKKYSVVHDLKDFASEVCLATFDVLNVPIFVCDKDKIIATSKNISAYMGKDISQKLFRHIENRKDVLKNKDSQDVIIDLITKDPANYSSQLIVPIIMGGDTYGALVAFKTSGTKFAESELVTLKVMANLISKQID